MITITSDDLKLFFGRISGLHRNNALAAYDYIKIDCDGQGKGTLTKTIGHVFVVHSISVESDEKITICVEEDVLSSITNKTHSGNIFIQVEGKKATLSNSKVRGLSCQTIPANQFPVIKEPDANAKQYLFTWDVLEAMKIAKVHIATNENDERWLKYVHIRHQTTKKAFMFGSNNHVCYFKNFKRDLPDVMLEPIYCSLLSKHSEARFHISGNYYMFDTGLTRYGFVQPEAGYKDVSLVIQQSEKAIPEFTIDRKQLVEACELAIENNPSSLCDTLFSDDGSKVLFSFKNALHDRELELPLDVEDKTKEIEDFGFNPKNLMLTLKSVKYEKITFSRLGIFFITSPDDEDFIGTLTKIFYDVQPQPKQEPVSDELPFKN